MKKILLVIGFFLVGILYWVIEPYSYIPFNSPELQISSESKLYECKGDLVRVDSATREELANYMASDSFLGVSAGFYSESCGLYTVSAGVANKASESPFTPQTTSRIASITKPITAVAVLQLFEKGMIDLDAPIKNYLSEFPSSNPPVTTRSLLNHTAGVPHYASDFDAMSFTNYENLSEATADIYGRVFVSPAGEAYLYSSFGYTILGRLIEVISEQSYGDYLDEHIFQPAGMAKTSLEVGTWPNDKSNLYLKIGPIFVKAPTTDLSIIHPAGGLQSTSEDLLKFGKAILSNKLLQRETFEMMTDVTDSLAPQAGDDPYGFGWSVNEFPEFGKVISHSGAPPGASTFFQIFLDKNVASVVLSNAFGTKNSSRNLSFGMADIGQLPDKPL